MRHTSWQGRAGAAALLLAALTAGCSQSQPAAATESGPPYEPAATVKDLMQSIVDPSADAVWMSVTTVQSASGTVETAPKTDQDWLKVRHGAVGLSEGANLLMMPGRHVARPGEKSETPGIELEPSEMEALIAKDRGAFIERAKALHEAGMAAVAAADAKNPEKLFEVGEQIERACENCHSHYWYPNEKIPPVPGAPR
jgi:cytochrome c556